MDIGICRSLLSSTANLLFAVTLKEGSYQCFTLVIVCEQRKEALIHTHSNITTILHSNETKKVIVHNTCLKIGTITYVHPQFAACPLHHAYQHRLVFQLNVITDAWFMLDEYIQSDPNILGHWHNFNHFGSVHHHNGLEMKQSRYADFQL